MRSILIITALLSGLMSGNAQTVYHDPVLEEIYFGCPKSVTCFDTDGSVKWKIDYSRDGRQIVAGGLVEYDEVTGYRVSRTTIGVTTYEYGEVRGVKVLKEWETGENSAIWSYDNVSNPFPTSKFVITSFIFIPVTEVIEYSDYSVDAMGNWVSRIVKNADGSSYVERRQIEYWDNAAMSGTGSAVGGFIDWSADEVVFDPYIFLTTALGLSPLNVSLDDLKAAADKKGIPAAIADGAVHIAIYHTPAKYKSYSVPMQKVLVVENGKTKCDDASFSFKRDPLYYIRADFNFPGNKKGNKAALSFFNELAGALVARNVSLGDLVADSAVDTGYKFKIDGNDCFLKFHNSYGKYWVSFGRYL